MIKPCLCRPSCTKPLAARQQARHREILRKGLSRFDPEIDFDSRTSSSSSHTSSSSPRSSALGIPQKGNSLHLASEIQVDHDGSFPSGNYKEGEMDINVDGEPDQPRQSTKTTIEDWWSDSSDSESNAGAEESETPTELGSNSDSDSNSGPLDDDVTKYDLIRILQEQFGDEWMQELHELHKYKDI
jgi:hypothetical protein